MNQLQENYIQEDEIDLRKLFQTILKGKITIAMITLLAVILSFIYVLKLPNSYKSQAVLIPSEKQSRNGLGGLGGLAAMAGINIGGGGSMTPDIAFNALLNDYEFMKEFVLKNKIDEYYSNVEYDKNYVFAFGYRGIYDALKPEPKDRMNKEGKNTEAKIYYIVKKIKVNFSISSDKKTSLITVSYRDRDREIAPKIIEAFLKDASDYLVKNNLRIINNKLGYFEKELMVAQGFELRQSISAIVSKILEEKVMMQSKTYYQCDILTLPTPSYIKDKTKPKRSRILVVSFITSIILGIFLVLFLEFIKKEEEPEVKAEK